MTIASEIEDLQTNLAAAKAAVTTKGGTVGDTGLAGLATEIASIPSGGGPSATQWGELNYYSVWETQCDVDPESAYGCTINAVDDDALIAWMSYYPGLGDYGGFGFEYREEYDETTGEPTGEYYWFCLDYENIKIAPEDMQYTTGIDVSVNEGENYANFYVSVNTVLDTTSPIMKIILTEASYNSLGSEELNSQSYIEGNGMKIYRPAVTSFTFGTNATTTPNGFLCYCSNLTSVDMTNASSLTSFGNNFLYGCQHFNQAITMPSTVTTFGSGFLAACGSFNQPVTMPSGVISIGGGFLTGCYAFNQSITIPNTVTSIGSNFLNSCTSFNQSITIPNTVTSIGAGFLNNCSRLNQPLTISNAITSISNNFLMSCSSFNQPITIPDGVTSIGDNVLNGARVFNQSLTIPNTVTSIGSNFLTGCSALNQPITISAVVTIGNAFLSYCASFNQPITVPASVTSIGPGFMQQCNRMVSVITCEAPGSVFPPSSYTRETILSTSDRNAACYVTGIPLGGSKRSEWLSALPDITYVGVRYRKLLDYGA